jgi:Asp-tRNA(Asn)/Glu-tRNA(Gln) amidotransferase C subunit
MAISRDQVLHVARLARLELSEEEVERLGSQLSAIGTPSPSGSSTVQR